MQITWTNWADAMPPEVSAHWIQDGLLKNDSAIEEAA